MPTNILKSCTKAFALVAGLTLSAQSFAGPFDFYTADQVLPATPGNGLTGQLWTNVDPNTDTLAQADAVIAGGTATANFLSTRWTIPLVLLARLRCIRLMGLYWTQSESRL